MSSCWGSEASSLPSPSTSSRRMSDTSGRALVVEAVALTEVVVPFPVRGVEKGVLLNLKSAEGLLLDEAIAGERDLRL